MLRIHLHVKFRAFFITFTEYDQVWVFPVANAPARRLLSWNSHGVLLEVDIE